MMELRTYLSNERNSQMILVSPQCHNFAYQIERFQFSGLQSIRLKEQTSDRVLMTRVLNCAREDREMFHFGQVTCNNLNPS